MKWYLFQVFFSNNFFKAVIIYIKNYINIINIKLLLKNFWLIYILTNLNGKFDIRNKTIIDNHS
jgi:hypothetical protein